MGVLLDSTFLIAMDRGKRTPDDMLAQVREHAAGQEVSISVISVMEFAHGVDRADTVTRAFWSRAFLEDTLTAVTVEPVTLHVALRAGRLDSLLTVQGNRIATADLLIAATALELGYSIVTANVRHFERVPGVQLLKL